MNNTRNLWINLFLAFAILVCLTGILMVASLGLTNYIQIKQAEILNVQKPSYDYLKSVTVYVVGCSEKSPELLSYPIGEEGMCWGGTGVVIKVDSEYTYILTNNHVAGKDTVNPILFIENEQQKVRAEIVKNHDYLDIAVLKVKGTLKDKTQIKGLGTVSIQDSVYVVGNPLGNKYVYSEGVFAGYAGVSDLFQIPCIYGNSGSGVFNKEGKLVAIVFALQMYHGFLGIPEAQITHSLAVDGVSIELFLKSLKLVD